MNPLARLAIEAGPLVVFFLANRFYGIMVGTAVFMVATAISVAVSYRLERRVPIMPLVGCVFVMAFGGLTLFLRDDIFIKIKPTVVNLLFASVLFVGLALRRRYLKLVMGSVLQIDDDGWRRLTWRWAVFFVVLAILNEIVWRNFSTDAWVNFKVFGLMPLSMVFGLAQVPLILRHQLPEPEGET
ncbi:MAG: septation protein A [Inquilinaceae bacterium]